MSSFKRETGISETLAPLCVLKKSPSFLSFFLTSHGLTLEEYIISGSIFWLRCVEAGQARLITEQQCRGFLRISDSCHSLNDVSVSLQQENNCLNRSYLTLILGNNNNFY